MSSVPGWRTPHPTAVDLYSRRAEHELALSAGVTTADAVLETGVVSGHEPTADVLDAVQAGRLPWSEA